MAVLTAVIYKEEDMYIVECPEVGTISQGKTIEEATELYLEEFPLEAETHSILTTFGVPGIRVARNIAEA